MQILFLIKLKVAISRDIRTPGKVKCILECVYLEMYNSLYQFNRNKGKARKELVELLVNRA